MKPDPIPLFMDDDRLCYLLEKGNPMSDAMTAAKCIDDLTKVGLDCDRARALVNYIVRSQEHLATRKDIRVLGRKIDRLAAKSSGPRVNIDSVVLDMRTEFKGLGDRLARKLFLFWLGITGAMFAVMVLFLALSVRLSGPG